MTGVLLRIAMWSPPRARSTMAMRVFEALGCAVLDEPFYAYWLKATKREEDPGYAATLAAHEIDWQKVEALLLGPVPGGKAVWYQKAHGNPHVAGGKPSPGWGGCGTVF